MAARLPGVPKPPGTVRLMLTGDVMLGRGVDQILPHHVAPVIFEDYVRDARDYVRMAEKVNGKLPERRGPEYPWGVALQDMEAMRPDVRVINLETAMTTHDKPWPDKGINYRCHPGNVATLKAGGVQVAGLANNHCLDWQIPGLMETLETLEGAGIMVAGAGRNASQACRPTVIQLPPAADGQPSRSAAAAAAADADTAPAGPEDVDGPRVLVWGLGHESSGVYDEWEAGEARPGVCMTDLSAAHAARVGAAAAAAKRPGSDIAVVSLHMGSNWGFTVPEAQRQFTRALIQAGVDVVHCHSSHHAKGAELFQGKLILHGAGDLISDYEGIQNVFVESRFPPEQYRDDVGLLWYADISMTDGRLGQLTMTPTRLRHLRLEAPEPSDWRYIQSTMDRECRRLGVQGGVKVVGSGPGARLALQEGGGAGADR